MALRNAAGVSLGLVAVAIFSLPGTAHANAGLPMIFVTFPYLAMGFVPVVLVEGTIVQQRIRGERRRLWKSVIVGNLLSTVIGVPITWLILLALQAVTGGGRAYGTDTLLQKLLAVSWQAPWLIPYENHLPWMIHAATLVLLAPFFAVSVWLEFNVHKRMLDSADLNVLRQTTIMANLTSYGLLTLLPLVNLIRALV